MAELRVGTEKKPVEGEVVEKQPDRAQGGGVKKGCRGVGLGLGRKRRVDELESGLGSVVTLDDCDRKTRWQEGRGTTSRPSEGGNKWSSWCYSAF